MTPKSTKYPEPTAEDLRGWLSEMIRIRAFETAADDLSIKGRIPGGIHASIGQEAVAVGVMHALEPGDVVAGTHRSHHHALALGAGMPPIMAELYGKSGGMVGGRGGSMHLADFDLGLWGSNGIVGGGLGIALGAALGSSYLHDGGVSVGFFGDGGANTGRVWEFINLAAVWQLPLVAICENNLYAVETFSGAVTGGANIAKRAAGFGLPSHVVDGQDVVAVHEAASEAVARARRGTGPTFLEIRTYRFRGHNTGDVGTYRAPEEIAEWQESRDPIAMLTARLMAADALDAEAVAQMHERAADEIAHAVQFAEDSEWSDPSTAAENVFAWKKSGAA